MRRRSPRTLLIGAAFTLLTTTGAISIAHDGRPGTLYRLRAEANFQEGCFPPCLCPILLREMRGEFRLVSAGTADDSLIYDLVDVRFVVATADGSTVLSGTGFYTIGSGRQELTLELTDENGAVQLFNSGSVAARAEFPEIAVAAAINGFYCLDRVVEVLARPQPVLTADRDVWHWSAVDAVSTYDVVAGDLSTLRETRGDFSSATTHCPVRDDAATEVFLEETPRPGRVHWYILRYRRHDGGGSWDSDSPSQSASRDPGIGASPAACD